MAKAVTELTAIQVRRLTTPGRHPVGSVAGLMLEVKPSGSKSWTLRTVVGSKRKDIGLGGYPEVTLAMALEKARAVKETIQSGIDPVAQRKAQKASIDWTFKACALSYIETHRAGWKSAKHAQQWENTLSTYVFPKFGDKNIKDIDTVDVTNAIRPLWTTKNETMVRVRNRIELVLSWAAAQGYRPRGLNPAAWRGHLDQVLPKPSKVNKRQHHAALPIDEMYGFMNRLGNVQGMSARCLEFTILTACRSGEARGACWSEIDWAQKRWVIPAGRMKAGREHRVPLSDRAIELLNALPRFLDVDGQPVDLIFGGRDVTKPLSDMSLTALMRRMGLKAVPHGFRSTFRDWAAERTAYPSEVAEQALAHAVGSSTELAYKRSDLFEKRRALMADWARFVSLPSVTNDNKVIPLVTEGRVRA